MSGRSTTGSKTACVPTSSSACSPIISNGTCASAWPPCSTTTPTRRPPRRSARARSQRLSDRPPPSPSRPPAEPTMVSPSTASTPCFTTSPPSPKSPSRPPSLPTSPSQSPHGRHTSRRSAALFWVCVGRVVIVKGKSGVREVVKQGVEAVDGETIVGSAGGLLGEGGGRSLSLCDRALAERLGGLLVGVVVEHGGQALAHVPFEIIGEHAEEDVGTHAVFEPVVDRPDMEVDGLDRPDGVLDQTQGFVAFDGFAVVERGFGQAGAHGVEAVEGGLLGDLGGLAGEGEGRVGDVEREVLGHFMLADDGADGEADLGFSPERLALAPHGGGNGGEIAFRGAQQILALAGALGGERGVAAQD